jgi:hypothetical protein
VDGWQTVEVRRSAVRCLCCEQYSRFWVATSVNLSGGLPGTVIAKDRHMRRLLALLERLRISPILYQKEAGRRGPEMGHHKNM